MSQITLLDMPEYFTKAQIEISAFYVSFESIHIFLKTNKQKLTSFIISFFNILEGKHLIFHAYLFPGCETTNKPPR